MYGTAKQVAAIEKGTYKVEFETMGNQIKEKLRLEPHSGRWLKDEIKMMHELIHGGPDMFMREFMSGLTRSEGFDSESGEPFRLSVNKTSDYPDMYVRILVHQTMSTAFFTALLTTEFLGYTAEHQRALDMFREYSKGAAK